MSGSACYEGLIYRPFEPLEEKGDRRSRWLNLARIMARWNDALHCGECPVVTLNVVLELLIREIGASYGVICRYTQRRSTKESDLVYHPVLSVLSIANAVLTEDLSRHIDLAHDFAIKVGKHDILSEPLRTGEPVIFNSVTSDEENVLPGLPSLSSYLGVPIMAGSEFLGILGLANSVNGVWRSDDWRLLMPLASMIGTMILFSEAIKVAQRNPFQSKHSKMGSHSSESSQNFSFSSPMAPFVDLSGPHLSSPSPPPLTSSVALTQTQSQSPSLFPLRMSPPSASDTKSVMSEDASRRMSDMEQKPTRFMRSDSHLEMENTFGKATDSLTPDGDVPPKMAQGNSMEILSPFVTAAFNESKTEGRPIHRRRPSLGSKAPRKIFGKKNKYAQRMDYMGRALVHVFESLSDGIVVFNESMRIITCNQACVTLMGFKDAKELLTAYPRFDSIIRPIFRFDPKHSKRSSYLEVTPRGGKSKPSDWRSDIQNLLFLAKSSRRVRLEAMLNRKASTSHEKSKKSPQFVHKSFILRDSMSSTDPHPIASDEIDVKHTRSSSAGEFKSKSGDESYCSVDVSISSFSYKKETFFSAVFRDVTQDKIYREKDTLLAFLSHEIRNPVQAITLGCQLLLQKSRSHTVSKIAKDLYLASDLLYSVVTDTIDYVQISTRNFQPKLENFYIQDALNACYQVYTSRKASDVILLPPDVDNAAHHWINADRSRLCQIVGNLLSNSCKFTLKGSIGVTVTSEKEILLISVKDSGCGIPKEEQKKLFQLFMRIEADQPNKELSTGLGLVLSRTIARSLNGDLYLAESSSEGTVFTLRMPFSIPTVTPPPRTPIPAHKKSDSMSESQNDPVSDEKKKPRKKGLRKEKARSSLRDKCILITDDNPLIIRVLEKILGGCRHLHTATNGQEAVDIVTARKSCFEFDIDIVLMDCLMPIMDGYTAARAMRNSGYNGPILALTGNSSEADAEKAKEAGYNDTILKPIKADDLRNVIQKWTTPPHQRHEIGAIRHSASYSPAIDLSLFVPSDESIQSRQSNVLAGHSSPFFVGTGRPIRVTPNDRVTPYTESGDVDGTEPKRRRKKKLKKEKERASEADLDDVA